MKPTVGSLLIGAVLHIILRAIVTVPAYLVAGIVGVAISVIWMWVLGQKARLEHYQLETGLMATLATIGHVAVIWIAMNQFELGLYPPWWPE